MSARPVFSVFLFMDIFHLSLTVNDYKETETFYCRLLGGIRKKTTDTWFNVKLGGHQITFHIAQDHVISSKYLHWGMIVSWEQFHRLYNLLQEQAVIFQQLPDYQVQGSPGERVKMIFADPSGYRLEYKAYKNDVHQF